MALKIPTSVLSHNNFKLSGIISLFTFFSMVMFISISAVWISVNTRRSWCEASLNTWSHGSLPTITWLCTLLYAIPWSIPTAAFWKSSYVASKNFVNCKPNKHCQIIWSHHTNRADIPYLRLIFSGIIRPAVDPSERLTFVHLGYVLQPRIVVHL